MSGVLSETQPPRYRVAGAVPRRSHDGVGLQGGPGHRHEVPDGVRGGEALQTPGNYRWAWENFIIYFLIIPTSIGLIDLKFKDGGETKKKKDPYID